MNLNLVPDPIEGIDFNGFFPFKILCWLVGHKWKYYDDGVRDKACLRCACYTWVKST